VVLSLLIHLVLVIGMRRLDVDVATLLAYLPLPEATRRVLVNEVTPLPQPALTEEAQTMAAQVLAVELHEALEAAGVNVPAAVLDPPPVAQAGPSPAAPRLAEPALPEAVSAWQPRQAVLAIEHRVADDSRALLARAPIPLIERAVKAPDIALPTELTPRNADGAPRGPAARAVVADPPTTAPIALPAPSKAQAIPDPTPVPSERIVSESADLFTETREDVTPLEPIERVLTAGLAAYRWSGDEKHGFFRVAIERRGNDVLPVLPKDVLFLQDCSNSMSEKRLFFCREGLLRCLAELGPEDRFDVVSFRQTIDRCFGTWMPNTPDNLDRAEIFVRGLRAGGNTDIYASLRKLVSLDRTPGRPVVVLLVSDGLATAGQTGNSEIIRDFTDMNDGLISVFCIGTVQNANRYLLDLLSYRNRGGTLLVPDGRWDIPEMMVTTMREIKRPVLVDVNFRFPAEAAFEVYPVQTPNMYLDRPLVLYGRFPRGAERVAFQAVGRNGARTYDMLFDLDLAGRAPREEGEAVAREWARHRIYHDIGRYTRRRDPDVLRAIRRIARTYNVDVPHRGRY